MEMAHIALQTKTTRDYEKKTNSFVKEFFRNRSRKNAKSFHIWQKGVGLPFSEEMS